MAVARPARRRHDLRAIVRDGIAFSFMVGVGESYVPAFVLAAGLGEVAAGLVATVPLLVGAVFQLVTPAAVDRLRSHRRWVVLCACLQAASFLPLIVGAVAGHTTRAWVFGAAAAYWGFGMATNPAWNAWVGTLVPRRLRASFFANRNRWAQSALFLGVVGGGALLHYGTLRFEALWVFALLFGSAAAARLASARYLASQSEPEPVRRERPHVSFAEFVRRLGASADGRLLAHLLAMQLTVYVAAPFFTPYMLGPLGLSYAGFTAFTAASFLARILALPLLGRLARRWGTQWMLWLGASGIVPLPALWLISDAILYLIVLQLAAGFFWAAFELAVLLAIFDRIDEQDRVSLLSFFNLATAVAITLGALLGSAILDGLGGQKAAYATVFLVSSGARLLTLPLLRRVSAREAPPAPLEVRTVAVRPSLGAVQQPILPSLRGTAPCAPPEATPHAAGTLP